MEYENFSRGLIAALRANGTLDFTSMPEAILAGLEGAIKKAEDFGIKFTGAERVRLRGSFPDEVQRDGVVFCVSPYFDKYRIDLGSREAAEDYFKHLLPESNFDDFKKLGEAFIINLRKVYNRVMYPVAKS